jgi:hypothetical protein
MMTLNGQSFASAYANHVTLADPYLDLSDASDFGVLGSNNANGNGGQANTPRQIPFNLRAKF